MRILDTIKSNLPTLSDFPTVIFRKERLSSQYKFVKRLYKPPSEIKTFNLYMHVKYTIGLSTIPVSIILMLISHYSVITLYYIRNIT